VGTVEMRAPRVNDKRIDEASGQRKRFSSAILPAWCRRLPKISDVLPRCICMGCPTGTSCRRWSSSSARARACPPRRSAKLTERWRDEQRAFAQRDLSMVDYVYCWADGIHVNIRLEEGKQCLLVLIGVRADGSKELITLADGYRESTESWADLLRDAKRRGMRAPVLAGR